MQYLLAAFPILIVLFFMLAFRMGGQKAAPIGMVTGLIIAWLAFGLNTDVFVVSQLKGLLLSIFVLIIFWPALLLYNMVDRIGGIKAIADMLSQLIEDHQLLVIIMAWAFSGALEGLAGFGIPVAVVAPMLVGLGVKPIRAVAAVAVGHAWSVTFGDMGIVYQTLITIVNVDSQTLVPHAALMLGIACIACGLATAAILGYLRSWWKVILIGIVMSLVQYGLAAAGLIPLSGLFAGLSGIAAGWLLGMVSKTKQTDKKSVELDRKALWFGLGSYAFLTVVMLVTNLVPTLKSLLQNTSWNAAFPAVTTNSSFFTASANSATFTLLHPGLSLMLTCIVLFAVYRFVKNGNNNPFGQSFKRTSQAAGPVSIGIAGMVGLAALMEHCGMTQSLAEGLSSSLGAVFPVFSPLVGVLGAFATGSNNNSNVLFAPLQNNIASILNMDARVLLSTQTTGGSLGSMIAPAKLIVGCSTVGLAGKDGSVLRITIIYVLLISLILGLFALFLSV